MSQLNMTSNAITQVNFSNILENNDKTFLVKEYIVPKKFNTSCLNDDFHYITNIKIQPFDNFINITQLYHCDKMTMMIGGTEFQEIITDGKKCTDENDFITFDIDFPTSVFYKYHDQILSFVLNNNNLYKIIVFGFKFDNFKPIESNILHIIYDHDSKYYQKDKFTCQSHQGMCICKCESYFNWYKHEYEIITLDVDETFNIDETSDIDQYIIKETTSKCIFNVIIINRANLTIKNLLSFMVYNFKKFRLSNYCLDKYDKETLPFVDCLFGAKILMELEPNLIYESVNNITTIEYKLQQSEFIYSFQILNKVSKIFGNSINVSIVQGVDMYDENINIDNINNDNKINPLLIMNNVKSNVKLLIKCNSNYVVYFNKLKINIGYIIANQMTRRNICMKSNLNFVFTDASQITDEFKLIN